MNDSDRLLAIRRPIIACVVAVIVAIIWARPTGWRAETLFASTHIEDSGRQPISFADAVASQVGGEPPWGTDASGLPPTPNAAGHDRPGVAPPSGSEARSSRAGDKYGSSPASGAAARRESPSADSGVVGLTEEASPGGPQSPTLQCTGATATRPILFVHGIWGDSNGWTFIRANLAASLLANGYGNPHNVDLYYDGTTVRVTTGALANPFTDPAVSTTQGQPGYVPCDARIFTIRFYSWNPVTGFDPVPTSQVSILTKARELSQVVKTITAVTLVKDVVVIAHSMGALDTRAYVEGIGSRFDFPCQVYPCAGAGLLPYAADIAHLVTVDGANAGSSLASLAPRVGDLSALNVDELDPSRPLVKAINYQGPYYGVVPCSESPTCARALPPSFGIDAIVSYFREPLVDSDGAVETDSQSIEKPLLAKHFPYLSDAWTSYASDSDDTTFIGSGDCHLNGLLILHLLPCLGGYHPSYQPSPNRQDHDIHQLIYQRVQPQTGGQWTRVSVKAYNMGNIYTGPLTLSLTRPTYSGPIGQTTTTPPFSTAPSGESIFEGLEAPTSTGIPAPPPLPPASYASYALNYVSGGPSGAGAPQITGSVTTIDGQQRPCGPTLFYPCQIGPGVWSLAFIVDFTSGSPNTPAVSTLDPIGVTGDSATFVGAVNPNGTTVTAWFEWGSTNSLGNSTPEQVVPSGSAATTIASALSGLTPSSAYYYRVAASNGTATVQGAIKSFATPGLLPSPTLLSPGNSTTNTPTVPTFSWTAVNGVSSYRLIAATSPAALPGDPTSSSCGTGCVLNTTLSATAYSPSSSVLAAGTTYYWEVHARSATQFGAWSPVFSFTTTAPSATSLSLSPSTAVSGTSVSLSVTLSGPAAAGGAQVSLSSSSSGAFPVPSSLTVPAGNTTGTVSVQAGTVATSTTVTVTASYNGSSSSAVLTVAPATSSVVISSFGISPSSIVGGFSPQGVVTLSGTAPANATISLLSNDTQVATVPGTVTVTPGYNNVAFPVTTFFTSGSGGATISASYNNTTYSASVTVQPVAVGGITFYPSTVTAGDPAAFTIYLNGPAGLGTAVSLSSSDSNVLQVPSIVSVPNGGTSISVAGTTSAVGAQTSVTVTASYNGSSGQGTLTLNPRPPLLLRSVYISPNTITGGTTASGTAYMSAIAPTGGASVSLASSSGLVQPPTALLVPAGAWYAAFSAPTSAVSAITNVTITGSYGGGSQGTTLTLVPPLPYLASIALSPTTIEAGGVATGTVTLTAPAPLGGAFVLLASTLSQAVAVLPYGISVPYGATSATFTITAGAVNFIYSGSITASYNGTSQTVGVTVAPPGTPLGPASLSFAPASVTAGSVATGSLLLTGLAPNAGLVVTLASDNSAVQVPPTVTAAPATTTATFTVTTSAVAAIATATVTARCNGISRSALLTVRPLSPPSGTKPVPLLVPPLMPVSRVPGNGGFSLTVDGSGFASGAQVRWNASPLTTTFVSSSQLQAQVPATSVPVNGSAQITVTNPGPVSAPSNPLPHHTTYPSPSSSFTPSSVGVTGISLAAAVADFNRDGKLDLVLGATGSGNGLSVFLGSGDGTFGPELLLAPNTEAKWLAVGDFNGDGKPDIAALTPGRRLSIYLGNGDGTFTRLPDVSLTSDLPNVSGLLAVADFNGDGALDLAIPLGSQAYVLLGNGDGTFESPTGVGSVSQCQGIVAADFNADGKPDLALSDFNNQSVAVLLGNGDGTFQAQQEYSTNGYAVSLVAADVNGDGRVDLVVADAGPCCGTQSGVAVLLGNGDGTFGSPVNYGAGDNFYSLAVDDVNGDGNLDLLVTVRSPSRLLIYPGIGNGIFSSTPMSFPMDTAAGPPVIADLNEDGAPDIIVPTDTTGTFAILLQDIAPVLQVSPLALSFAVNQGMGTPDPRAVTIRNSGGGSATWSASASEGWVVLDQSSGIAPSTLNVLVNAAGFQPGTYSASITVSADLSSKSPQTISLSLTVAGAPTVTTPTSSAITDTAATLGGNVTTDGGATITERGVVWSVTATNSDPMIGGSGVMKVSTTGTTGAFTVAVTGLSPGTEYSFKPYAINSVGVSYTSPASTFSTLATPTVGLDYFTLAPCRVVDTRGGAPIGGPVLEGQQTRVFAVAGICAIPPTAKAVSINVTVTQSTAAGNVRLFPAGLAVPPASTINYGAGQTRANNAIVSLDLSGQLAAFVGQTAGTTVHLIIDVNGYFE